MSYEEIILLNSYNFLLEKLGVNKDKNDMDYSILKQIEIIGNSSSQEDAIQKFSLSSPIVKAYKFAFSFAEGISPGFSKNKKFSKTAAVRSLFSSDKLFLLDSETLSEMGEGISTFRIDYSISLDSQTLSYLEPFFDNKLSKIPSDMTEVFEFISRPDVFVDPLPYMLENINNLNSVANIQKIRGRLKAYEVLRTLDVEELRNNKVIKTVLPEKKLESRVNKLLSSMRAKRDNKKLVDGLKDRYLIMYCQLLKMIIIQLSNSGKPAEDKLTEYFNFCHQDLKAFSFREISVAKKYFDGGQDFTFFRKIQINRDRIFNEINGMTWDLCHIRQLEENMVVGSRDGVRYFFPAILTFDRGMNAVMDLYPLKSLAFNGSVKKTIPFYDGDFIEYISDGNEKISALMKGYFEKNQILWRDKARDKAKNEIGQLVMRLESELEVVAGVKKPADILTWYYKKHIW